MGNLQTKEKKSKKSKKGLKWPKIKSKKKHKKKGKSKKDEMKRPASSEAKPPVPPTSDNKAAETVASKTPEEKQSAVVVETSKDTSEEDIRRQLLAKAKDRGIVARSAVAGDRTITRGFSFRDFKPVVHAKTAPEREEISKALLSSFLFKRIRPKQLEGVIDSMAKETFVAGKDLISQGAEGDKFYVIMSGEVDVFVNDDYKKTLGPGANFGDIALMYNCPRTATIRAKTDCVVFSLERREFKRYIIYANEADRDVQKKTLREIPLLSKLSEELLDEVSAALLRKTFDAGVTIIKEGDVGNVFYIVEEGHVDVSTAEGGFIRTMQPLDYFGEQALIKNEARSATCVAKTKCTLLAMDRDSFENLFGPLQSLQAAIAETHSKRLQDVNLGPIIPISKLEIVKDVGRGAFGRVKIVRHKTDKRIFALKVMMKYKVVKTKNAAQVVREKQLLAKIQPHPLIVRLESAMQDDHCLYLVQEFINGGDLFHRLYNIEGCFQTSTAQYYAACVALMLERLHQFNIVYRDLKPENLLLTSDGVLKMVDFGMAKVVQPGGRTYTLCGTPEYMAPEVIHSMGHSKGVDFWALGVLIYEMLCGSNPFEDPSNDHSAVYRNITRGIFAFPKWLRDTRGKEIIRSILVLNPAKRLGCGKGGVDDIKKHPWFATTDFNKILQEQVQPPIKPVLRDPLDISNFYPIEADNSVIKYNNLGMEHDKVWEKEFPVAL